MNEPTQANPAARLIGTLSPDHNSKCRRSRRTLWLLTLPVLAVLAAHHRAIPSRAISFDDHQYLLENPLVLNPGLRSSWRFLSEILEPSTVAGYYQPLAMISLMLDVAAGGGSHDFVPFHITSLALHVLNCSLIVLLIRALTGCTAAGLVAGLSFGVHPMTVEPIPWIGERKTLLAAAFALGSLLAYLRYARGGGLRAYWLSFALALLAMMSKPTTVPLPFVLLILDWWPLQRLSRRAIMEKAPFLLLSAAFAFITVISQDRTSVAIMPTEYSASRVPLILCHNIIFYPAKMLWPVNLSAHYAFPDPLDLSNSNVRWGLIGTCVLIPALVVSLRWTQTFVAGWLIFFVTILPTMQIIGFSDVIASDKYAYLPSIGFLLIMGTGIARAWSIRPARWALGGAVLTLAAAAGIAANRHYDKWKDSESLYEYMLSLTPTSAALHNNLAVALLGEGRFDEAIEHYQQALTLKQGTDETYTNIGVALVRMGKANAAMQLYQEVLARMPTSYSIHSNLGALLAGRGQLDEAISHYEAAIRAKPRRPEPHNNLANALLAKGLVDRAIESYRRAIELRPNMAETQNNLGIALAQKGDLSAAAEQFGLALSDRPDYADAHLNLGAVLANQGHVAEAIDAVSRAVRLAPGNVEARYLLGELLRDAGRPDEARAAFKEVLRLSPDHSRAKIELREPRR